MDLAEKPFHGIARRCVMNCGECGVIGECSETVYMYLVEIVDEVFDVVAGGALVLVLVLVLVLGGVGVDAKCAKSVVCV